MHYLETIMTLLALAGAALAWVTSAYRQHVLSGLTNPDGSPSIDEYVTRPMLSLTQTCVKLCRRIYGRVEDLPDVMVAQLEGLHGCRVFAAPDQSVVCCLAWYSDAVLIVWRGTRVTNRRQLRANGNCAPTYCYPGGYVHAGLQQQFALISCRVFVELANHIAAGRKLYVTGHSQGAGLAALTCHRLRRRSDNLQDTRWLPSGLITFGSLRPGDDGFADHISTGIAYKPAVGAFGIQRYRNNNDAVTLVPSRWRAWLRDRIPRIPGSRSTAHSDLSRPIGPGPYSHVGECLYIWPCGVVTRSPGLILRAIQQAKSLISDHAWGDALADHSIDQYENKILALRIPKVPSLSETAGSLPHEVRCRESTDIA